MIINGKSLEEALPAPTNKTEELTLNNVLTTYNNNRVGYAGRIQETLDVADEGNKVAIQDHQNNIELLNKTKKQDLKGEPVTTKDVLDLTHDKRSYRDLVEKLPAMSSHIS